jgi:hypothetical protein
MLGQVAEASRLCLSAVLFLGTALPCLAGDLPENPLALPVPGSTTLRILSPTLLELTLITRKEPDPRPPPQWNFVDAQSRLQSPPPSAFLVKSDNRTLPVQAVGFRRRALYAPLKRRDLRLGNYLYLQLASPVADGETVQVQNPAQDLWSKDQSFSAVANPDRWSPVLHVNQEGYLPDYPKKAMLGYYLGSLGEMPVPAASAFHLLESSSGKIVFTGTLTPRPDVGYNYPVLPYQNVLQADFSNFKTPGLYRLEAPGLGASFPFRIDEGIAADFTRALALGLYHQRCGAANDLPFTRFTHAACHLPEADVPNMSFDAVNAELAEMTADFSSNPRHTAPQLKDVNASLYPFVNTGKIDVSGGHHDAGDYSKYTIDSAQFIHALVFAADAFPGVGALDNLGLPESGDGKSDLLEEAKWEADFLAKMQDADGGFYFLVYPRDREYENDVSLLGSNCGDPQVVFPKTTAATAAAVAALAEMSSSPLFKKQFPQSAALYFTKAKKGWDFLQRALAKYGQDGSYQKITHYGDDFMHDDELAWAATEMFLATGDPALQKQVIARLHPDDPNARRWTWWRLFESYGCAIRSFAFAARTGRLPTNQLDQILLGQCEDEIIAAADDAARYSAQNAYATSFPDPDKQFHTAGWYFSLDRAFDLAVACQINYPVFNDPRPRYIDALLGNLNYEAGCNPVNMTYITGLGWKRQHDIVNQYAQNSRRSLPPTGIALGNIQEGFMFLDPYKKELGALTFPPDWDTQNPYPFYDRWGDSFNTTTESVSANMARSLATCAFLMARTPLKTQPWRCAPASVSFSPGPSDDDTLVKLSVPGLDLAQARCVWEVPGRNPVIHPAHEFFHMPKDASWLEAEAWWPDGRRAFISTNPPPR